MRELSTEMLNLLKSGAMIGSNRPTAEVLIGSSEGFEFDWLNPTDTFYPDATTPTTRPSFTILANGNVLYMYQDSGSLYMNIISDIETFIGGDNTATTRGTPILTGKSVLDACIFNSPDGGLYFIASYLESSGDKLAKVELYHSDLGDGSDWSLYSTITSYDWSSLGTIISYASDWVNVSEPYFTDDGEWVLAYPTYSTAYGYIAAVKTFGKSYDNGLNWSIKYSYLGAGSTTIMGRSKNSRNLVNFKERLYLVASNGYGSEGSFDIYESTDYGETWSICVNEGLPSWGLYYTLASDTTKLYLITQSGNIRYTEDFPTSTLDFVAMENTIRLDTNEEYQLFSYYTDESIYLMSMGRFITGGLAFDSNMIVGIPIIDNSISLQPKSITINRSKGMAGGLTLELDNKAAILAPDGTANPQLLWPNKEVVVKQGYGQELLKTFTGLIDSISMSRDEQGVASVTVSARDKLKVALDHLIRNAEFLYTLTYTNMLVEDIWKNLVGLAGLTYNTVEATGLTISEKTFSWETYADAFSWLDEIAGFETYCDEEGLLNFVWDGRPSVVTTAYSFVEGVDITRLGYEINDVDLFYTVAVYGKLPADPEVEGSTDSVIYFARQLPQASYWNIPSGKVLRIDAPDADTQAKCEIIADKAIYLMQTRARQVTFSTIGIPHLQRGDFIQVEESSTTISEIYRITDISTTQSDGKYMMNLTCYYHAAPEVV